MNRVRSRRGVLRSVAATVLTVGLLASACSSGGSGSSGNGSGGSGNGIGNGIGSDLGGTVRYAAGSAASMGSALRQKTSRNEDIVVALWRPHWAWHETEFAIKALEDPENAWGGPNSIYVVGKGTEGAGGPAFSEAWPQVATWIANMEFTSEQIVSLAYTVHPGVAEDEKLQRHLTSRWLRYHQPILGTWGVPA